MNALEVKNLVKYFDKVKAVDDVSFDVPEGSIFGLIGRNGAGKNMFSEAKNSCWHRK